MNGIVALNKAKKYIDESLQGLGALQGQKGDPGKDGKDAPSIINISINEENVLSIKLSNGEILQGGIIKTLRGETGKQGIQGIQGIQGEKGNDGYPFLIYKEYSSLSEFNINDFPQIELMFILKEENSENIPVYRYTGDEEQPYSYISSLSTTEVIKGDKGEQGLRGNDGKSAYEIAVDNQYIGTEKEWLESIKGKDGFSPIVSAVKVEGGHKVTITDATHTEEFIVKDGADSGFGGGIPVNPPTGITITNLDESALIRWTDPIDVTLEGVTVAKWAGTVVVRKAGSEPVDKTDGVIVVDSKVRNKYQTDGFTDNGLTNGVTYYYGIFPYTKQGEYTTDAVKAFTPEPIYPNPVTGVNITAGDGYATIIFSKDPTATKVKCVYKGGSEPKDSNDGRVIDNFKSGDMITDLEDDVTYYVKLYACNEKGREFADKAYTTKSVYVRPKAAVFQKVMAVGDESVTITFSKDSASVRIKCVYKQGSVPQNANDGVSVDNFVSGGRIDGIHSGVNYFFVLYSYNEKNRSTPSGAYEYNLIKIVTWADGTDQEIMNMIDAAYENKVSLFDIWAVGDVRNILIGGIPYAFAIMDFDHDEIYGSSINNHYKTVITVGMVDILPEESPMYNREYASNSWGSDHIELQDNPTCIVLSKLFEIRTQLSELWQENIKKVRKKRYYGGTIWEDGNTLWIPSYKEITNSGNNEGTQYPYYAVETNRIKERNGEANDWWLRRGAGLSVSPYCVYSTGLVSTKYSTYLAGISVHFCL